MCTSVCRFIYTFIYTHICVCKQYNVLLKYIKELFMLRREMLATVEGDRSCQICHTNYCHNVLNI